MPRWGIFATLPGMRYRIQTAEGRHVEWEQDGPVTVRADTGQPPVTDAELWLTDDEAQELCLELSYQIMRARHPERNWPK